MLGPLAFRSISEQWTATCTSEAHSSPSRVAQHQALQPACGSSSYCVSSGTPGRVLSHDAFRCIPDGPGAQPRVWVAELGHGRRVHMRGNDDLVEVALVQDVVQEPRDLRIVCTVRHGEAQAPCAAAHTCTACGTRHALLMSVCAGCGSVETCAPAGCAARSSRPNSRSCRCCTSGRRSPPRRTGSPCRRPAAERQAPVCQQLLHGDCVRCRPTRSAQGAYHVGHVPKSSIRWPNFLRASGGDAPMYALMCRRSQRRACRSWMALMAALYRSRTPGRFHGGPLGSHLRGRAAGARISGRTSPRQLQESSGAACHVFADGVRLPIKLRESRQAMTTPRMGVCSC